MSLSRSAAFTAASADSRITVRIVPSTGLATAPYAVLAPERQGVGQVQAVEPALAAEALGHAAEDLAGDDARVAARAHQRPEADRRGDPLGRPVGRAPRPRRGPP